MQGKELIQMLTEATGLPPQAIEREVDRLLKARGLDPHALSLNDFREVMAAYLQEVLLESKAFFSEPPSDAV